MKKTIIAASLALSLLSGCATTDEVVTVEQINERTVLVQEEGYEKSAVSGLEQVRLPINTLFNQSVLILNDYIDGKKEFEDAGACQAALSMEETEEGRVALLEKYKTSDNPAEVKMYEDYMAMINDEHMKSIYDRIGDATLELAFQVALFASIDQGTLWADIDFLEIPNEMDRLGMTIEQIDLLTESFGILNDEYEQNKAAGFLK